MKRVIVTIDTEGHVGSDPITRLIWGKDRKGQNNGISLIMDLCDKANVRALFFVDMAEAWDYGEDKIADVLRYIDGRCHDVGVHIHPDHMADPTRLFLHEYSYEEQFDIIGKCTKLYEKILGRKPIAFRAGKYGANRDTLDILAQFGYKADFSEFFGQKWCGIVPPVTGNTTIILENGLLEIPTMAYESRWGRIIHRFDKYDTNSTWIEQQYILKKLRQEPEINPIVMFAHSFSFLDWRQHPDTPFLNRNEMKKFQRSLAIVSNSYDLDFITLDDLVSMKWPRESKGSVPCITGVHALVFYFFKACHVLKARIDIKLRKM